MAGIRITQAKKRYGKVTALHGLDLHIADGEFIVIVGPSGCGKSTLLRMIAGLETITEGEIAIAGKRVNELEPMARNIAMVFQNYALYPHMSVFQNLAYGLKIAKTPAAEITERVERVAKLLQLTPLLARKPAELSGGQRQRVAMGRAIVRKPAVFLFDEPLSNLDARLRGRMRLEIKALQNKLGITAVYVTHDQVEAMTLADRVVVMNHGAVEQVGAPAEIYNRPASKFVGGFMGAPPMNFICIEELRGADLGLPARFARDAVSSIGIRPEKISLAGEHSGRLEGRLVFTEPLGAHAILHVRIASGSIVSVTDNHHIARAPGAALQLSFDNADMHFFDRHGARVEWE
ncbi:MAG: sn-glycerol-3-phosphate ABC transporter ATP-binding protein UgpC [Gammaproteobacteria bacterium]